MNTFIGRSIIHDMVLSIEVSVECCYFRGFLCTGISLTWPVMIK